MDFLSFCNFAFKFILIWMPLASSATVVTTVNYKGKIYHVDVVGISTAGNVGAEVWFREKNNASSVGDLKIAKISANTTDMKYYLDLSCRAKKEFDTNKGLLGCLSVVGSVFCAVGTTATSGVTAFVCSTTWAYAIDKGAADCLKLSAQAIAKHLGGEEKWKVLALIAELPDPKISEAISAAIDYMCEDVIQKKD